jgi:hypothetical protein
MWTPFAAATSALLPATTANVTAVSEAGMIVG